MVLNKIGEINKIYDTKKSKSIDKTGQTGASSDSVQLSTEGLKAAEEARVAQMVRETPDVRTEKVQAIKQQRIDGTYDRHLADKVLTMVADKLLTGIFK